jgi:hypothetical protein
MESGETPSRILDSASLHPGYFAFSHRMPVARRALLHRSPEGKHLGTLKGPEHPHNLAWGDDDGKTLYLAAQTGLYRMRLNISGIRPGVMTSKP